MTTFGSILESVREKNPRIHCITNYVTANDCANILLACGASPIMADAPEESAEITALCSGLVINLGTLSAQRLEAMLLSGKKANELDIPVVLDPVGAGASVFRTNAALKLLSEISFSVIRGNLSEIKVLAGKEYSAHGVDTADIMTSNGIAETADLAKSFSHRYDTVTVITGAEDIAADPNSAYVIRNGHPIMSRITGCGCMLSALTASFLAASSDSPLISAAAAICTMDICGEIAAKQMKPTDGNAGCRDHIIDSVFNIRGQVLDKQANIKII